jgi:hypothetical protein
MAQQHDYNNGELVEGGKFVTGNLVDNVPQLTKENTPPRWGLVGQYMLDHEQELGFKIDANYRDVLIQAADVIDEAKLAGLTDSGGGATSTTADDYFPVTGTTLEALLGISFDPPVVTGGSCICTETGGGSILESAEHNLGSVVVEPATATKQKIVWKVLSGPAKISKGTLSFTGTGNVELTATVKNGHTITEDFVAKYKFAVV